MNLMTMLMSQNRRREGWQDSRMAGWKYLGWKNGMALFLLWPIGALPASKFDFSAFHLPNFAFPPSKFHFSAFHLPNSIFPPSKFHFSTFHPPNSIFPPSAFQIRFFHLPPSKFDISIFRLPNSTFLPSKFHLSAQLLGLWRMRCRQARSFFQRLVACS